MRLAIIGTAGRKDDFAKLSAASFDRMCAIAREIMADLGVDQLVSGGAAWADHVAVRLANDGAIAPQNLRLFLPANFSESGFDETSRDGSTSAYYHKLFSRKALLDSIAELRQARSRGAQFAVNAKGFFARNLQVAQSCDALLAFTFGSGTPWQPRSFDGNTSAEAAGLKDGGTAHTFTACRAGTKIHVPLAPLA